MEEQKQVKFLALYNPISSKLSNYCRLITDSPDDANDLLHDTLVATFENFDQLKSDVAFPSYIFSAAYNIYSKQLRRRKFKGKYNEAATIFLKDANASPEMITDLKIILEKMKQLPAEQYEALILFYVSDLPLDEIKYIQQVPLSTVKSRLSRGKLKLLKLLNEQQKQIVLTLF